MIEKFDNIKQQIEKSNNILLSTHENPDCDGLGSEIALYYYAKSLGKNCKIINCTKMSSKYAFIDPDNVIEVYNDKLDDWLQNIDLAIISTTADVRLPIVKYILENENSVKYWVLEKILTQSVAELDQLL